MDKFSQIERTLAKVKKFVYGGLLPSNLFDEFVDACLRGYVDDLKDQQLSILFDNLNQIEDALRERELPTDSVIRARDTLLFVLQNNGM
jgi:hypothetical protein